MTTLGVPTSVSTTPQAALVLGSGGDCQHQQQRHQRYPLQLPAQLVAMGQDRGPTQFPGLGERLSRSAKRHTQALAPIQREHTADPYPFLGWQDNMIRDDATWIHGKHMIQFGGMYQHNFNWHSVLTTAAASTITRLSSWDDRRRGNRHDRLHPRNGYLRLPRRTGVATMPPSLGIVSVSQIAYTRSGQRLDPESALLRRRSTRSPFRTTTSTVVTPGA